MSSYLAPRPFSALPFNCTNAVPVPRKRSNVSRRNCHANLVAGRNEGGEGPGEPQANRHFLLMEIFPPFVFTCGKLITISQCLMLIESKFQRVRNIAVFAFGCICLPVNILCAVGADACFLQGCHLSV